MLVSCFIVSLVGEMALTLLYIVSRSGGELRTAEARSRRPRAPAARPAVHTRARHGAHREAHERHGAAHVAAVLGAGAAAHSAVAEELVWRRGRLGREHHRCWKGTGWSD